ncbi:MAG: NAD(P)-dependent alcohol dehydrogenase [Peptoniphilaceae bacterium]
MIILKAFVMKKIGETAWIEKEKPICGPNDAILKPIALAPCTSDIHTVYEGAIGERSDMVLGHEGVGEIVEVGNLVKDFKVGDKCIVPAITPDWNSVQAQDGFSMHSGGMLAGWKFSNFKDGVFAEFFHVNDADGNLAHLPEGMDLSAAVMLSDMVPTGLHGAELADVQFGDKVLVIGIGPVGLMSVAGAQLRGASEIYAVGTRPKCIEVAKEFGATEIISYKDGSISEQVLKLTNNQGVDKVIVAGGTVDTFIEAITAVKPGGIVSNVNYLGEGDYVKIPRAEWGAGMGHKEIRGGLMPGGRRRMERLADMVMTGRIHPEKLITHTFNGIDHLDEALELMNNKPADLIKPIVII